MNPYEGKIYFLIIYFFNLYDPTPEYSNYFSQPRNGQPNFLEVSIYFEDPPHFLWPRPYPQKKIYAL